LRAVAAPAHIGPHGAVGPGIEGGIDGAVRIEAGDIGAAHASDGGKLATEDEFAVGLGHHGVNRAVDIGVEPIVDGHRLRPGVTDDSKGRAGKAN
jgi:hypothetical protein